MSLALKELQVQRAAERRETIARIILALIILIPIAWFTVRLVTMPSYEERMNQRVKEIVNSCEFDDYYGRLWGTFFPLKYRTKEQVVRQDLGLDPKDRRLLVFGGLNYSCADAPSNWMPGDYKTACIVKDDIEKQYGREAADAWFKAWGFAVARPADWGFFSR